MPTSTGVRPRRALVLSGGGARGAYEAGVLRYLFEEIGPRLAGPLRFDLILGTSVGAIHACFVAATAHLGRERGALLRDTWRRLHLEQILRASPKDMLLLPRRALALLRARSRLLSDNPPDWLYGLLDSRSLEQVVTEAIPWSQISRNVAEGRVEAICLAATQVATGRVVAFIEGARIDNRLWTHDPTVVPQRANLQPAHALASAAIPVLFPALTHNPTSCPLPASQPALVLGQYGTLTIHVTTGASGSPAFTPTTTYRSPNTQDAGPTLASEAVPYPKLPIALADPGQPPGYAGHLELTYTTSKLQVKDVHEHNHLGRHSTVLWREVGSNPTRVIIDWATKENLAVSVPVHDLAVAFSLKTATPVVVGDFTIDNSTRRTYDQNGAPIANPPLTLGAIR